MTLSYRLQTFPPLMVNMIKAGEVGGFLDQVLVSVANNFEAEVKLKSKIKSAMTYPVVVFVIAILATGRALFLHAGGGPKQWDKTDHVFPGDALPAATGAARP